MEVMRGVRLDLEKRLKAAFGQSITCEQTEVGLIGDGGFVWDFGPRVTITAMQFRNDGLYVRICQDTWYIVLRIKTDNMVKADAFVRTQIPCKAPKTEWPPSKAQDRFRKLRQQLRSVRFYSGILLSAALKAPLRMLSRHRRST